MLKFKTIKHFNTLSPIMIIKKVKNSRVKKKNIKLAYQYKVFKNLRERESSE